MWARFSFPTTPAVTDRNASPDLQPDFGLAALVLTLPQASRWSSWRRRRRRGASLRARSWRCRPLAPAPATTTAPGDRSVASQASHHAPRLSSTLFESLSEPYPRGKPSRMQPRLCCPFSCTTGLCEMAQLSDRATRTRHYNAVDNEVATLSQAPFIALGSVSSFMVFKMKTSTQGGHLQGDRHPGTAGPRERRVPQGVLPGDQQGPRPCRPRAHFSLLVVAAVLPAGVLGATHCAPKRKWSRSWDLMKRQVAGSRVRRAGNCGCPDNAMPPTSACTL